ncbi:hypothetical protein ACE103_30265 [Bradyrhizobium sp. ma5]|uniref:hypothetical protein n=1 Tax=Bradyrhizobium sp. ma5 TaxID=3344828 RepID=UPI0035D44089
MHREEDEDAQSSADAGYYYNERPNVCFLAAGAWLIGWSALEEYASDKYRLDKKGSGRVDLYVVAEGGGHAVFEAKYEWLPSVVSDQSLRKRVRGAIAKSTADARCVRNVDAKFGCVFFVPRFSKQGFSEDRDRYNEAVGSYIDRVKSIPGADLWAWSFPKLNRCQQSYPDTGYFYPGHHGDEGREILGLKSAS